MLFLNLFFKSLIFLYKNTWERIKNFSSQKFLFFIFRSLESPRSPTDIHHLAIDVLTAPNQTTLYDYFKIIYSSNGFLKISESFEVVCKFN